jgi:hypothetical protein
MSAGPAIRQANEADLPVIEEIITAAYSKYLARMDRPPAPMLRDYAFAVEQGAVWVVGTPIAGLISLSPADDSLLVENLAVHPAAQGAERDDVSWRGSRVPAMIPARATAMANENANAAPGPCPIPAVAAATIAPAIPVPRA